MEYQDSYAIDNFFNLEFVECLHAELEKLSPGVEFWDKEGIFKGKHIATQRFIAPAETHSPCLSEALTKICNFFRRPVKIVEVDYVTLYLPWDIHCDLIRTDSVDPFYNVLIPLHDVDSRTILFNETSETADAFWKFKQTHPQAENPIDQDIWNQYLDMCWPEDRLWLTLKEVMPAQRAGQFLAFKRQFFHSSDNFHKRVTGPKQFLQVILDKDK